MQKECITTRNAVSAAHYLLALDRSAIAELYRQDARQWVQAVQEALVRYESHAQKHYPGYPLQEDITQRCLESLVCYTQSLMGILTPEAQKQLVTYLINISTMNQSPVC